MHVTNRQLQVFTAAAEALSFARVAERMHLTPSAVSFQIRQIEYQVGYPLFERIGRKVALTEAGRSLLNGARPVLQALRDLDVAMLALQGAETGRVTLGLVSTAKYIVPHMIAQFRTVCPGIHVQLREGNRSRIAGLLQDGGIDMAVMGQYPDPALVRAERFATHPTVVIAAPAHPLHGPVAPKALWNEWFIVREPGSGTRALTDDYFRAQGFTPPVALESSSNEMIKQAVMAGMGLAVMSRHTINLELSLGLLRVLDVPGFPIMRSWFVTRRRTAPALPAQTRLQRFLVEHGPSIIAKLAQMGPVSEDATAI